MRRFRLSLSLLLLLPVLFSLRAPAQSPPPPPTAATMQTSASPKQPLADETIETILRFADIPQVYRQKTPLLQNRHGWPGNFECFSANIALFRLVNNHRHPWLDAFCLLLLYLGSGYVIVPVTILTGFFRRQRLWMLLAAVSLETLLVSVMKQVFAQPRPGGVLPNVFVVEELSWRAFPSGDTAMAFTLAWVLKSGLRWPARAAFIVYAVAVAYERVYFGAHFPLDVLAGAAVGIFSAMLTERLFKRKAPVQPAEEVNAPEPEEVPV
ncbi:MAG: phosphatase PAP2 family protein [Armatimonadota bacterium]